MKILIVNWSWYATGGDWTYIENVRKLYESNGHEVIPFAAIHEKNQPEKTSDYFVKSHDYKELNKHKSLTNGIKVLQSSVVSHDALQKLEQLLDQFPVDIAHLQNVHHYITPAIIDVLKRRKIPVIWTLHDFKIICPENSFISNGVLCEKCLTGSFYHCALSSCKKHSFMASSLASFEAYYYHYKKIYNKVDQFLCPSDFLRKKFIQFGFSPEKLTLAHSCYDVNLVDEYLKQHAANSKPDQKYVLYIGRLESIKGVHTLVEAVKDTPIHLKIVGSGSDLPHLQQLASGHSNIEFLGFKNKEEVFELTRHASFVVCPSVCYENLPFSVIETFLFSRPVVGALIGGIPELVINEKTGLLFEAGNANHLCEKLRYLWDNDDLADELGRNARKHAFQMIHFDTHWKLLSNLIEPLTKTH